MPELKEGQVWRRTDGHERRVLTVDHCGVIYREDPSAAVRRCTMSDFWKWLDPARIMW